MSEPTAPEQASVRLGALERVLEAVDRLAEAGPVSELIERAPEEAATALKLDRVLLSRVEDGCLYAETLHCAEGAGEAAALLGAMREAPVRLDYPLVEAEMLRRRRARQIAAEEADPGRHAFGELMRWAAYVASPIVLEGRVIGFLHGDRAAKQEPPLGVVERDALERFARTFADALERASLRRRLRIQRQELRQVASWADARTGELSDAAIDLAIERNAGEGEGATAEPAGDSPLRELVTKRELEVLEHMVKGETNSAIAGALTVSEETVKFHVKNILRKLGASNRAEAASRYLRLAMRESNGTGRTNRRIHGPR